MTRNVSKHVIDVFYVHSELWILLYPTIYIKLGVDVVVTVWDLYSNPPFLQIGHGIGSILGVLGRSVVRPLLWQGVKVMDSERYLRNGT